MSRNRAVRHLLATLAALMSLLWAAVPALAQTPAKKPNILVIWGDDIGIHNISAYNLGLMGYRTPGIDRIAKERTGRRKGHDDVPVSDVVIQSAKRVTPAT